MLIDQLLLKGFDFVYEDGHGHGTRERVSILCLTNDFVA